MPKAGRYGPERALKRLRHMFTWAIKAGHAKETPFRQNGVAVIEFLPDVPRSRRLEGDEEQRLLAAASPWMQAMIRAALETGCRAGELRSLQWRDVKWDHDVLLLPAVKTKTATTRTVPMSQKLRALLDMRRHGPDGKEFGPDGYVFGNEVGEYVSKSTHRDHWNAACEAAGIPKEDGSDTRYALRFHDLRREFGWALAESGAPTHIIRDMLGHANVSTTDRYLSTTSVGRREWMQRFEEYRTMQQKRRKEEQRKQKRSAARRIRTKFAQTPAHRLRQHAGRSEKNPANLLN
jgi:integrase